MLPLGLQTIPLVILSELFLHDVGVESEDFLAAPDILLIEFCDVIVEHCYSLTQFFLLIFYFFIFILQCTIPFFEHFHFLHQYDLPPVDLLPVLTYGLSYLASSV